MTSWTNCRLEDLLSRHKQLEFRPTDLPFDMQVDLPWDECTFEYSKFR